MLGVPYLALIANAVRICRGFSLGGQGRGQAMSVQMEMFPATAKSISICTLQ